MEHRYPRTSQGRPLYFGDVEFFVLRHKRTVGLLENHGSFVDLGRNYGNTRICVLCRQRSLSRPLEQRYPDTFISANVVTTSPSHTGIRWLHLFLTSGFCGQTTERSNWTIACEVVAVQVQGRCGPIIFCLLRAEELVEFGFG